MARPRRRRCGVCGCVTARYSHTEARGQVVIWVRDPTNGEVLRRNGLDVYCTTHAPEESQ